MDDQYSPGLPAPYAKSATPSADPSIALPRTLWLDFELSYGDVVLLAPPLPPGGGLVCSPRATRFCSESVAAGSGSLIGVSATYFSVSSQVDLERLAIVLESERGHGEQDILTIDSLTLLLLTLLGCCLEIQYQSRLTLSRGAWKYVPSLVMNEINSLTHSCIHSFASFAILAFSGRAVFMIRATGAKL